MVAQDEGTRLGALWRASGEAAPMTHQFLWRLARA